MENVTNSLLQVISQPVSETDLHSASSVRPPQQSAIDWGLHSFKAELKFIWTDINLRNGQKEILSERKRKTYFTRWAWAA